MPFVVAKRLELNTPGVDLDLVVDNGNGSISQDGGGNLQANVPAGLSGRWGAGADEHASVASLLIANWVTIGQTVLRFESRLTGWTSSSLPSGTGVFPGVALWLNRDNSHMMAWSSFDSLTYQWRVLSNAESTQGTLGGGNPNTTPFRFRIYWNPTTQAETIEGSVVLNPNEIRFFRSANDGVTYQQINPAQSDSSFVPTKFGVMAYTFDDAPVGGPGPWPQLTANYDYISIETLVQPMLDPLSPPISFSDPDLQWEDETKVQQETFVTEQPPENR